MLQFCLVDLAWDDDDIGSMSHVNFYLTRMSHHLAEPFDSMN